MKNSILIAAMFLLVAASGCKSLSKNAPPPPAPTQAAMLQTAAAHEQEGQWEHAYKIYSEMQNSVADLGQYRLLQLKAANALFQLQNYPAALAALAPMPELPATLHDCQKLAMAARILEKMGAKDEYVEALLEVALDNSLDEPGVIPFKAAGYAEMGRIYVAHGKTARAVKCFEYAARLFDRMEDREQATACRNIMEYLR